MTAGFFSPLPPARTGIADYAAALLPALRAQGRVEIAPRRASVNLYHIGNNRLHAGIYRRALAEPGVAALHDALLQHLFLGTLAEAAYVEEFVYNYGAWSQDLARELWRGRSGSGMRPEYYRYPMLKRLAERSRAVVVHNPAAARMVREHCPATPVVEIPHLWSESWTGEAATRARECHFGIFGYLRESKRVLPVLRAFGKVREACPDTSLRVAGEFASADLERAAAPCLAQPGVVRDGHLPEADFREAAGATRVCINLRNPAAGETSGIAIRLMGMGKAVLVTDGEEVARFPEPACVRVDPGLAEEEMLEQLMLWLRREPAAAREIGHRAAGHIREQHAVERVSRLYWETLCAYC
ncbi:MAG: glycosyltransferase [Acidobacteria bacterium]|nr:glycosyltransferase [Acidobacteriota bacterium]